MLPVRLHLAATHLATEQVTLSRFSQAHPSRAVLGELSPGSPRRSGSPVAGAQGLRNGEILGAGFNTRGKQ